MAVPRMLLINPWIYDFAAFDFWAKPLGLLYIAESLRRKGVEVTLIDCLDISRGKKYGTGHFVKQEIPKPEARRYPRASPWHLHPQALLDALWASSHSPTGKARGTLPFGFLDAQDLRPERYSFL